MKKTKIWLEMAVFGGFAVVTSQFHIVHAYDYLNIPKELWNYLMKAGPLIFKLRPSPNPLPYTYNVKLFSDFMLSLLPYSLECLNTISHLLKALLHFTSITSSSLKTDLGVNIFLFMKVVT